MSAKAKPSRPAPPSGPRWFAFQLPCGGYLGRAILGSELGPQPPERSIPFNTNGVKARKAELLEKFPGAKVVPSPHPNFLN